MPRTERQGLIRNLYTFGSLRVASAGKEWCSVIILGHLRYSFPSPRSDTGMHKCKDICCHR
jgi:hypothetical protein